MTKQSIRINTTSKIGPPVENVNKLKLIIDKKIPTKQLYKPVIFRFIFSLQKVINSPSQYNSLVQASTVSNLHDLSAMFDKSFKHGRNTVKSVK